MDFTSHDKKHARSLFDKALKDEIHRFAEEVREKAAGTKSIEDINELEHFIRFRKKQIDLTYDYRYSVLPRVFGRLLAEGKISKPELEPFSEEIRAGILKFVNFWADEEDSE